MNAPAIVPTETLPVFVYCIRNDAEGTAKIGISRDPLGRIRQLQTASAYRLRLVCEIPCYPDYETVLHKMFHDRRLSGEWFNDSDGFVSDTLRGTSDFLSRCGVTMHDLRKLSPACEADLRKSAKARQEHADALEAEGQIKGAA